ncbi:MAG: DDE-type integrase/transposase/recombinase [Nitrososphaerota archaeon]|nr:DDE-type integrase/transposase/recombinase [Nitrososphaerota archaeon]
MNVISENADGSFSVPSQSVGEIAYLVRVVNGQYQCNCPDFKQRHEEIEMRKHIHATRFWVAARVELEQKPKPKVFADDAVQCGKCGSIRVVKNGTKRQGQAFVCKDCGHKFTEKSLIRGSRYTPEVVSLTLDPYFSGMSLRKIARTMNSHYGLGLGNATIYRWIQKFVPRISEYVSTLSPELSDTWHADEVFLKMKGGQDIRTRGGNMTNMAYLWNVMDRRTRFLLASKLSKFRGVGGAARALREASKNAGGSQPERIFTDGLNAYSEGISFAFTGKKPEHIAKVGVRKPHAINNRIERLNGTVRERMKVQRGWKTMTTSIAEGQRIHYNFVKPHAALEGQTPAERAGVGIEIRNKWLGPIQRALENRSEQMDSGVD